MDFLLSGNQTKLRDSVAAFARNEMAPLAEKLDQGRYLQRKGYQQARVILAACSLGLAQASLGLEVDFQ